MSEHTNIAWTDATHNFWRGCAKVPGRPGCANCYAETLVTTRLGGEWGKGAPRVRLKDFDAPLRWNRKPWVCDCGWVGAEKETMHPMNGGKETGICDLVPHRRRVFSLSLGDWLDDEVPIEWLADMLDVIRRCQDLDFLLLSKRIGNWKRRIGELVAYLEDKDFGEGGNDIGSELGFWAHAWDCGNPPENVWMGASVENQAVADAEIPKLLAIPAKVRFLSMEPLLGSVNLPIDVAVTMEPSGIRHGKIVGLVDWVIVGGESGPKARPCNVEWIRSIKDQCQAAGVPCFVKQLGSNPVVDAGLGNEIVTAATLTHPKGGDPAEWAEDLRVRQFPKSNHQ